ncbi:MAG: hypothetical protein ACXADB_11725 [Candidatus Hermodarchaeia archaeon]
MTSFRRIKDQITSRQLSLLYLGLVSSLIYLSFKNWGYDDPFITYRYAVNLANGDGFVYNIGEDVLSTTSPLFSLLLALFRAISISIPETAILIGVVSLTLGGLCLWNLGQVWGKKGISWIGILVYPIFPLLLQTLGSETPLFLLFSMSAYYFHSQKRHSLSFTFGAFALLTRPEGALVIGILLIAHVLDRKAFPRIPLLITLLTSLPWLIFATLNFGSPIPVTLAAKQHQGLLTISERFLPRLLTLANWGYVQRWSYWVILLMALIGFLRIRAQEKDILYFLLWPILHSLSLGILGVSGFFWYYAPLVPGLLVITGSGIEYSASFFHAIFKKKEIRSSILSAFIAVILFIPSLSHAITTKQNPDKRLAIYRAIGEWIETNTESDDEIGTLEVGIIGYYSNRRMIDFSGVIQPEIAEQLTPNSNYQEVAEWAIKKYKPDYVILSAVWASQLMQNTALSGCQVDEIFEGNRYGYHSDMTIYHCDQPSS